MVKKRNQKCFYISNVEVKEFIDEYLNERHNLTGESTSEIIEEYILAGIVQDFPDPDTIEFFKRSYARKYDFVNRTFDRLNK